MIDTEDRGNLNTWMSFAAGMVAGTLFDGSRALISPAVPFVLTAGSELRSLGKLPNLAQTAALVGRAALSAVSAFAGIKASEMVSEVFKALAVRRFDHVAIPAISAVATAALSTYAISSLRPYFQVAEQTKKTETHLEYVVQSVPTSIDTGQIEKSLIEKVYSLFNTVETNLAQYVNQSIADIKTSQTNEANKIEEKILALFSSKMDELNQLIRTENAPKVEGSSISAQDLLDRVATMINDTKRDIMQEVTARLKNPRLR